MYGTVNRKKKKDGSGEYYKDAWYYVCKHRKLIDGQKCTYRRQPPQGPIDKEVTAIVGQATVSQDLLYAMYWYSNQKTDGIIERENYNKPKSENSRQPGCPEEKVKAIEDAMRHFQMI